MNIKKRLMISNTITIIIPFIITFVVGLFFIFVSSVISDRDLSYNNFKKLTEVRAELFNTAGSISRAHGDDALSSEFKQYLSQRIDSLRGEFIITSDNKVSYASRGLNAIDTEKAVELVRENSLSRSLDINNKHYFVQESSFKLSNGARVEVILLAPFGQNLHVVKTFVITIILAFIISFVGVNLFMTYSFSSRILKPVSLLTTAANEISGGNLQYEVIEDGDEEIKELCREFEVMRLQLKDSINMKMKYDDNRNMLVSSISHDLRTPITSIKGYIEGVLDGVADTPEKLESYLRTIYSKTEHIDAMIDDLLLYSRLELNQLPFDFEKTDIKEYVDFCISEVLPEFERSNIRLEVASSLNDREYIKLDRERMRRVIMNIVDNSRKYMDKEQGRISVMLRETNLSIIIEFRDNGSGIRTSDTDKVFDRFYRADSARSEASGSGLGLAIAKQIVEGHKGRIWAISHGNEGTSILVSLAKMIGEQREEL